MIIYERRYPVNIFETDLTGNLSLVSLFDFFQDIAGRNASQLGFGREHLMTSGNIWVLSRISISIERMPEAWSDVTVRTWPRGTDGIFALRDFEIATSAGELIIRATSSWVIIDFATRKLQRPDKALAELNIEFPDKKAMTENALKISNMPAAGITTTDHSVTISDLDINQHVNNAMYIKWACDTYDKAFIESHTPLSAEVNYISEGHPGQEVCIISASDPSDAATYYHTVKGKGSDTEMCRIRLKWRDNN